MERYLYHDVSRKKVGLKNIQYDFIYVKVEIYKNVLRPLQRI